MDRSREEAARREQEERARQARIEQGMGTINQSFGQFGPDFYDRFRGSYLDYYTPQVTDQYSKARNAVTYRLADQGILRSSAAQRQLDDLEKERVNTFSDISRRADDAVNQRRGQVENERATLEGQLRSSADPNAISIAANNRVGTLQGGPELSPLGPLFANAFQFANRALQPRYDEQGNRRTLGGNAVNTIAGLFDDRSRVVRG